MSSKIFLLSTFLACTGAFPEKRPAYSTRQNPAPAHASIPGYSRSSGGTSAFNRPPSSGSAYDNVTPGYGATEPSASGGYGRRPSNGYSTTEPSTPGGYERRPSKERRPSNGYGATEPSATGGYERRPSSGYGVTEPSVSGGYERKPSNGYGSSNSVAEEVPANYDFTYSVVDETSGNNYGQSESRDGEITKGHYFVHLPDGRLQRVDYTVDGDSGFVATVSYEGEARYDNPTPNNVQGQYGAPSQPQYGPPQQATVQPQYGAPVQPEYGAPAQPEYGAPAQSEYGAPAQPEYGVPAQPEYGAPAQPEYGAPQSSPPGYSAPGNQPEYGVPVQSQYNSQPTKTQPQYG